MISSEESGQIAFWKRSKNIAGKKETIRSPVSTASEPAEDDIRKRAYELYLERKGEPGSALDDWLQAEADLKLRRGAFL
jgi:DUF2934 family protein